MKVVYEEFRKQHYQYAKSLTEFVCDLEAAEKLCQAVYESLESDGVSNWHTVRIRFLELYNDMFAADRLRLEEVLESIYSPYWRYMRADFDSFEDFLKSITPYLKEFPLFDRVVIGLRIENCMYGFIAEILNKTLSLFCKELIAINTLSGVDEFLSRFRKELAQNLSVLPDREWLCELVEYKGDPFAEAKTWNTLRDFCHKEPSERYGRKQNPARDRYGELRDIWHRGKMCIAERLKQEGKVRNEE